MAARLSIYMLVVTLIASCKTSTQKTVPDSFQRILTDTTNNRSAKRDLEQLQHYNSICKEIGLNKLYDDVDSFEVRAWRQFSIFGIATDEEIYSLKLSDSNVILTFLRIYCRQVNYDNNEYRHWDAFTNAKVDSFVAISKTFSASILDSLHLQAIWNLKAQSVLNIPDSLGVFDGTTTSIEIASKTKYKLIKYHSASSYYEMTKIGDIKRYIDEYVRLIYFFKQIKYTHNSFERTVVANKSIEAIGAGRKYNRQFCKAKLQFGQDKQHSSGNLNFNKQF